MRRNSGNPRGAVRMDRRHLTAVVLHGTVREPAIVDVAIALADGLLEHFKLDKSQVGVGHSLDKESTGRDKIN